jgi:thiol-disulfide isomerase/thioredoxin
MQELPPALQHLTIGMNSNWIRLGLYAIVAAVAMVTGFFAQRHLSATQVASAVPTANAATPADAADKPDALVDKLPQFSLHDREGVLKPISSWPGKSLVINFWATWCGPCRKEIPLLRQLQTERGPQGFQVVGIAVDHREDVLKFANDMHIDYPVLIGEQDAMTAAESFGLHVQGFPFTIFTDSKGRIVTVHMGELKAPQAKAIFDAIARVNKGEISPAKARAVAAEQLLNADPDTG